VTWYFGSHLNISVQDKGARFKLF